MTRSQPGAPGAFWNAALCAVASPSVRKAWLRWSKQEAAWHTARAAANTTAEHRARTRLNSLTRRLAAVPARSLHDVAPKTLVAGWLRCWGDDGDLLPVLEAAIAAETMAINHRALPSNGDDRMPSS